MPTTPRTAPHLFTCPPMECRNHQYLDQPSTASNTMAATATHRTTSPTGKTTGASLYAPVPLPVSPLPISHIPHGRPTTDSRWHSQAQPDPERGTQRRPRHLPLISYVSHTLFLFDPFPPPLDQTASNKPWHGMACHNTAIATASQVKSSQEKCHVSVCLVSAVLTHFLARTRVFSGFRASGKGQDTTPKPTSASGFDGWMALSALGRFGIGQAQSRMDTLRLVSFGWPSSVVIGGGLAWAYMDGRMERLHKILLWVIPTDFARGMVPSSM
jgi:hypothetical protein